MSSASPSRHSRGFASLVLLITLLGCSKDGGKVVTEDAEVEPDQAPTFTARELLRDPSQQSALRFLQELNARGTKGEGRRLSKQQQAFLATEVKLTPEELTELDRPEFTPMDAVYLTECLLFRDAVLSLEMPEADEATRAKAGFGWMHRMILRKDRRTDRYPLPAPPMYAALRGSGDALERAYVFMALAQQLDLDTALIGPSSAADQRTTQAGEGATVQPIPFWAVGVRVGEELWLFDPHSGQPWPSDTDGGVATFRQMQANPGQWDEFRQGIPPLSKLSADDLANALVFVSPPLSAMAPRMSALETGFGERIDIHLRVDPPALRDRLVQASGGKVQFWNPAGDPGSLMQALARFLPVADGGLGLPQEGQPLISVYRELLGPIDFYPPREEFELLSGVPRVIMFQQFQQPFIDLVLAPNSPHDQALRGRYTDAVRTLTDIRDEAGEWVQRARNEPPDPQKIEEWCRRVNSAYADRSRASRAGDVAAEENAQLRLGILMVAFQPREGPLPAPASPEEAEYLDLSLAAATGLLHARGVLLELDATFLSAVCMHEKAERVQERFDRSGQAAGLQADLVQDAWRDAAGWWTTYLRTSADFADQFPERAAHAREMAARCEAFQRGE